MQIRDYLHPRYWLTWLGFGFLRLISLLPFPAIAFIGTGLGTLVFHLMGSRRRITEQNIGACFPEFSHSEVSAKAKRCFQLLAITTVATGVNWWASPERLSRLVSFEGIEHYDSAIAQGQNVILLAPHSVALEVGGILLSRDRSMISMYQYTRNKLLNDMVKAKRARFGGLMVEKREPLRNLLKLIRKGHPFYYLPDQDAGSKGLFVPFFGIEAATFPMLSKFAKVGNAVVLPMFTTIKSNGKGWHVTIRPALENFPSEDEVHDTRVMNESIESMVRPAPEQYFWVHKRFKTRPANEKPFYS